MYTQLNLIRCGVEQYLDLPHTAMFHGILEGFLQDAEETQRNFLGQAPRDILGMEIDLDILLPGKLSAKAPARRYESQVFQLRRVQTVRQSLDIAAELRNASTGLPHATASFAF